MLVIAHKPSFQPDHVPTPSKVNMVKLSFPVLEGWFTGSFITTMVIAASALYVC
jgi:hypothetical protein